MPAIRKADPNAQILAPGTSGFPWPMLEHLCAGGLLQRVDGVSVHPYRSKRPETARADYRRLRQLMAHYAPAGKSPPPIVSSEWGYSNTHWGKKVSRELQAAYLVRELLTNIAEGVPLSIWYDWCNDGPDPTNTEHNFGTVTADREPKPAMLAVKTLNHLIGQLVFLKRLDAPATAHLLLFRHPESGRRVLVAWIEQEDNELAVETTGHGPTMTLVTMTGAEIAKKTERGVCRFQLQATPVYVQLPNGGKVRW